MKKSYFLAFISVLIIFCISLIPFNAGAQYMQPIISPGVDLSIQMDASSDNEASWHSYYGDGAVTEETLTAHPGDEVTFRVKTWNEDTENLVNLTMAAECDQPLYFIGLTDFYNPDIDENSVLYDGDWSGGITLPSVQGDTFENSGAEAGSVKVFLKSDVPDQTVINCAIAISDYGQIGKANTKKSILATLGIEKAKAQVLAYSIVRISVSNNPQALPQTGAGF